jgi:phage terminase large subunit
VKTATIDLSNLPAITNDVFYPLYGCRSRFLVLMGGTGSGKSYYVATRLAVRLMLEPGHRIVAFRKVHRTCKVSVFAQFKRAIHVLGVERLWKDNLSELSWTYLPNGNMFMCAGLDDHEKLKSIEGITGAWLEEATEMSPNDLEQINLRVRNYSDQIILTFNPISITHWLKGRFFDESDPDATVLRTTYKDNRFLDPKYCAGLESIKDRDRSFWLVYACGEWGVFRGLIYDPWPMAEPPAEPAETFYGLDFGFNDPMALVRVDARDQQYYATELVHESGMTTADLIVRMNEMNVSKRAFMYADSAEPDRIEEIRRAGYRCLPAKKGQGSVHAGISLVKSLTIYTRPGNVNLNRELSTYKWAEDKDGKLLDEPVDIDNHAMDAVRYALQSHIKTMSKKPGKVMLR